MPEAAHAADPLSPDLAGERRPKPVPPQTHRLVAKIVAALAFMKKALKRHGSPEAIVTDGLKAYPAAMRDLGNEEKREVGRHANNRVENSHLPFRRRERAMLRFRRMKTLQKFASIHASVHNHLNLERHIVDRQTFKARRSAALAEWKSLVS